MAIWLGETKVIDKALSCFLCIFFTSSFAGWGIFFTFAENIQDMMCDPDYKEPGYPWDHQDRKAYDKEEDDDSFIITYIHILQQCEKKQKCLTVREYKECRHLSTCSILNFILKERMKEGPNMKEIRQRKGVHYEPILSNKGRLKIEKEILEKQRDYEERRKKHLLLTCEKVMEQNKPKEDSGPTLEKTSEETKQFFLKFFEK